MWDDRLSSGDDCARLGVCECPRAGQERVDDNEHDSDGQPAQRTRKNNGVRRAMRAEVISPVLPLSEQESPKQLEELIKVVKETSSVLACLPCPGLHPDKTH